MNFWKVAAIGSSSALALVLACGGSGHVEAPAYAAGQPAMVEARESLQRAHALLERAEENKGGHRARAIGLVDQAIAEVNAGIEYARTH